MCSRQRTHIPKNNGEKYEIYVYDWSLKKTGGQINLGPLVKIALKIQ